MPFLFAFELVLDTEIVTAAPDWVVDTVPWCGYRGMTQNYGTANLQQFGL